MVGARSPSGKKRPLAGSSNYRPVRGPGGSSFLTCPGCGRSMHAATLGFHKQACPLFAEYELGLAAGTTQAAAAVVGLKNSKGTEPPSEGLKETPNAKKSVKAGVNLAGGSVLEDNAGRLEQRLQEPGNTQQDAVDKEEIVQTGELEEEEFMGAKDAVSARKEARARDEDDLQIRKSEEETAAGGKDLASELQARETGHAREKDEWQMQMAERESEMTALAGFLMQAKEELAAAHKEIEQLKLTLFEKGTELIELRAFKKKTEAQAGDGLTLPPAERQKAESMQVGSPKAAAPVTPAKDFGVSARTIGRVLDAPIFSTPPPCNVEEKQVRTTDEERSAGHAAVDKLADAAEEEPNFGQAGDGQEEASPNGKLGVETALKDRPSVPASPVHTQRDTQEDSEQVRVGEAWHRVEALLQEAEKGSEADAEVGIADRAEEAEAKTAGSQEQNDQFRPSGRASHTEEKQEMSTEDDDQELTTRGRKRGRVVLDDDASSDAVRDGQKRHQNAALNVSRRLFNAEDESDDDEPLKERLARKQRAQEVDKEVQRQPGRLRKVGSAAGQGSPEQARGGPMLTSAKRRKTEMQVQDKAQRRAGVTGLDSEDESDRIEESNGSDLRRSDEVSEESDSFVVKDGDGSQEPEPSGEADFESGQADTEEGADSDTPGENVQRQGGSILEQLGLTLRKPKPSEWQYEADLTAALGKDYLLCMKAVCALYRRQTLDERVWQAARHKNNEGFSQTDAERGSKLAVFLTEDNPTGPLVKSVEDLEHFHHRAPETCRDLALKYSAQLWEMVVAKRDPAMAAKRDPHFP